MPVTVQNITFQDDYTGSISGHGSDNGVPYLMGCVGDFMYCKIEFQVGWNLLNDIFTFNSTNNTITLENCAGNVDSFIDAGFQNGDTILIQGTPGAINDGTFTIVEVLDDNNITVLQTINSTGVYSGVDIFGVSVINAFDFYYNMSGNNENNSNDQKGGGHVGTKNGTVKFFNSSRQFSQNSPYNSLTDIQSIQKFTGLTNPLYYGDVYQLEPNATSQAWFNNEVDGVSCVPTITSYGMNSSYAQVFVMTFPFLITPFFLANQLSLLQNAYTSTGQFSLPPYFLNQCLGFIYQIDAKFNITNLLPDHSTLGNIDFTPGNTAWFNTFFTTGTKFGSTYINSAQYKFDSITYTNASNATIKSIDIENTTNVSVDILNVGGSMTSGEYVVNFMWLPTNPSEYQNYSAIDQTNFRKAFLHDRCRTSIGAGAANGDQYGTPTQAIVGVTTAALSGGVTVNFEINLGSLSKSTLANAGAANQNYMIWITPQDPSVTTLENTNRSAVICDVNQGFVDTDDPSILAVKGDNILFYNYPDTYVNGFTNYNGFAGTYGLAKTDLLVNYGCNVTSMQTDVIVEVIEPATYAHALEIIDTFTLTSWANDTSSFYDGNISQININQTNSFNLPANDPYLTQSIQRYNAMDTNTQYALEVLYPFQIGFQWWQNVNNFAPMFFKYHTQYWPVYTQGYAGQNRKNTLWTSTMQSRIRLRQTWNVLDTATGVTTQFVQYGNIGAYDSAIQEPNGYIITTTDIYGNDLGGIFASDVPTQVQVVFNGQNLLPKGGDQTAIGSISVNYSTASGTIFDTITTLDFAPETPNSLWNVPLLSYISETQVVLIGTINLQNAPSAVGNITVTASLTFSDVNGTIVTDNQNPITDDAGNIFITG